MATLDCLYTFLRNPTAKSMYYGWILPRGKTIAAGATTTVAGDLISELRGSPRKLESFEQNLADGDIEILQTPTQHAWCTDDAIKTVDIEVQDDGSYSVVATDPTWEDSAASPSPSA